MYDLIGDIHGHADELVQLLQALDYHKHHGVYRHPERKLIFLGDFIDRGSQIREVLEIVRSMVESGHALAVMGNHELNAVAYHSEDEDSPGEFLRRHTPKNQLQLKKTIEQLTADELASYLDWFRTLPMWLDLDGLRAVHACWDDRAIAFIGRSITGKSGLTSAVAQSACKPGNDLFRAVEIVLKGKEAALPAGMRYCDREGHVRTDMRVRWYLSPVNQTYRTYALTDEIHSDVAIEDSIIASAAPYPLDAKPVFIGHYWLSARHPELLASNVACLDFSVAKGGFLCAYRWDGEQKLNRNNFVAGHLGVSPRKIG